MGIRFLAQRLDCLPCLCLQAWSENGFVRVPIIFGYRRGFGTVRPARMEFLVGTGSVRALLRDQLTGLCISRAYGCTAVACVAVHDVPSAGGVTVAQRSAILSPSKRQRTNP